MYMRIIDFMELERWPTKYYGCRTNICEWIKLEL